MKKFVKCKKTYGDDYTENKLYELIYGVYVTVRTNFNCLLAMSVSEFKEYFYTEQELRKKKIKKLLNGKMG